MYGHCLRMAGRFVSPGENSSSTRRQLLLLAIFGGLSLNAAPAVAQQQPLGLGDAVVTKFSGAAAVPGPDGNPLTLIDPAGAVANIIELRAPGRPPQGAQWFDKPQRPAAYAAQVGQVFGVALDDATPPNIYLSATSAFGLHRMPGNAQWMPGMWGAGGGPGTVYILDAKNRYQPRPLAQITLNGRPNSGAALGNIAFDRWNRQLFVSDLETGMIHRIRASDGANLGVYDHGVQGRANFNDATNSRRANLPPIPFNPASRARISDCPVGEFQYSPECWNLAGNGRRVWGLGVGRLGGGSEVRLFYSIGSSPEFDPAGWNNLSNEEKRNSVWSVGIRPDGAFDLADVRREFILPDFFVDQEDITRAGYSRPVSDIAFPKLTGHPVMLLAERGGIRNFGLDQENSFATPHESRTVRYELFQDSVWRPVGRYDVGSYHRVAEGTPRLLANSAGGAAFGYGYSPNWSIDQNEPDQTVWITGDALCSPAGPCNAPGQPASAQSPGDPSQVHGIQGTPHGALAELAPAAAFAASQQAAPATDSIGVNESFLIDADFGFDAKGEPITEEFTRNDATTVGDIAVYEVGAPTLIVPVLPPPPVVIYEAGHSAGESHARFASHSTNASHFRYGSHWPAMSHNRWGSHFPAGSFKHWPPGSWVHLPPGSVKHLPPGSVKHVPPGSLHFPPGSIHIPLGSKHFPVGSKHFPVGSIHVPKGSVHFPPGSKHFPPGSKLADPKHLPIGSKIHVPLGSKHFPPGSKLVDPKHLPLGSVHVPVGSKHFPPGSKLADPKHLPIGSKIHVPLGSKHFPPGSKLAEPPKHLPVGSKVHVPLGSKVHVPLGSAHFPPGSKLAEPPKHLPVGSKVHVPVGSKVHVPVGSKVHVPVGSKLAEPPKHLPVGSKVHVPVGSKVHVPLGSAHSPPGSKVVLPKHKPVGSKVHVPVGSKVHTPTGSKVHVPLTSKLKTP